MATTTIRHEMPNAPAPIVTHLNAAFGRNDAIACEGWYYPHTYEHRTTSSLAEVTCPVCLEELNFFITENAPAAL